MHHLYTTLFIIATLLHTTVVWGASISSSAITLVQQFHWGTSDHSAHYRGPGHLLITTWNCKGEKIDKGSFMSTGWVEADNSKVLAHYNAIKSPLTLDKVNATIHDFGQILVPMPYSKDITWAGVVGDNDCTKVGADTSVAMVVAYKNNYQNSVIMGWTNKNVYPNSCSITAPSVIDLGTIPSEGSAAEKSVYVRVTCEQQALVKTTVSTVGGLDAFTMTTGLTGKLYVDGRSGNTGSSWLVPAKTSIPFTIKVALASAGNVTPGAYTRDVIVRVQYP